MGYCKSKEASDSRGCAVAARHITLLQLAARHCTVQPSSALSRESPEAVEELARASCLSLCMEGVEGSRLWFATNYIFLGLDGVVGIAARYRMDGPWIESQQK